jgi:NADPH-dependent ferric siderophore reductase
MGPNADFDGVHGGIDFLPPARTGSLLIGGDETAVPAITSILQSLPRYACGAALIEVPTADDVLDLVAPPGLKVTWLPRNGRVHGELLIPAVKALDLPSGPPADLEDVDADTLWEVPEPAGSGSPFYAWLAGEAGMVKTLRRYLVRECGVDRGSVAFMGYWRLGRPEDI